jgi:hypothetical protein
MTWLAAPWRRRAERLGLDTIGLARAGRLIGAPGRGNQPLLLLFNAEPADTRFVLPPGAWQPLLDTADDAVGPDTAAPRSGHTLLQARSVALLAGPAHPATPPRTSA